MAVESEPSPGRCSSIGPGEEGEGLAVPGEGDTDQVGGVSAALG